ncbi:MAG TPA: imidazolonepropionase, partial [Burkholderiaceae bacterium]
MSAHWDALWRNVHLATMDGEDIRDGALAVRDGRIAWLGQASDLPACTTAAEHDGAGAWLTPGLIDSHTHIVYGGNRSDEFEARLNGATYRDIANAGGGINSTVRATRAASDAELMAQSLPRVRSLLAEGVTTLEIKSGYGLSTASEAAILRTAREIGATLPVTVKTTFLGAHALPPEYAGRKDDYIAYVCDEMLPQLAAGGLVDAVDAFCENIGFSLPQTERVFARAASLGLPVKLHAEQLSDLGGSQLLARYRGLSSDHLE